MNNFTNNKGVALILSIMLMTLMLFLSMYYIDFTMTENKISNSQSLGEKTYYLAESGISEMIWKLKNDDAYKNNFETDPSWIASFTRNNPFGSNSGSYSVSITNNSQAHGDITATGTIAIGGKLSQRVIKTKVYRALGQTTSLIGNNSGYADGNIDINSSNVNFHGGGLFLNGNFNVNFLSTVVIDGDLNVVGNFIKQGLSNVTSSSTHSSNINPPAPAPIPMPAIDFDSASSTSYKNLAIASSTYYTQAAFDELMANNQNLTINDKITYVEGDVDVEGAQNLVINGLLVIGRDLMVGHGMSSCRGSGPSKRCGANSITVNHATGTPSGILAKRKINFELWTGIMDLNGLIYANDQISVLSFSNDFKVIGGLVSRKLTITSVWQPLNITYNNTYVTEIINTTTFSPIITIDHWEEEY